jgi:hypothetical protein
MTESDLEYLIRTLSEARSRATELTVPIRARAGADHRLVELVQSAVLNIEKLLREVRVLALDRIEYDAPAPAAAATPRVGTRQSEHWLQGFIGDLIGRSGAPDDVSFETVEQLLQQYKQTFLKDLETARRMYRVYPHLFPAESFHKVGAG